MSVSIFASPSFPSHNGTFSQPGIKPVNNGKECIDLHGRSIPQGVHYVPGPDECTLCVCDAEGKPIWCKAVLCSPPQECKSFRVGNSCCEFICLDDTIKGGDGHGGTTGGPFGPIDIAEVVPKIVIASICSMLSLALLSFLVYRLRQRHIQGRMNSAEGCHSAQMCDECDDTRSLDFSNDCYFERPGMNANFFPPHYMAAWKPPSTYFPPRGEAPPPYEEAIATTSNCLIQAPMPSYMTMCSSNGIGTMSSTTIILTNENINHHDQVQDHHHESYSLNPSARPAAAAGNIVVSAETEKGEVAIVAASKETESNSVSSGGEACPSRSQHSEPGPSSVQNVATAAALPSSSLSSGSKATEVRSSSCGRHRGNSSTCRPSRHQQLPFPHPASDLPPYSASNFRDCFRHSLTLPRHPGDVLDFDLDTDYGRRHQQRYSLQFNVADWSSSSSTLSLSTPNTPNGRPESSLSSSTSTTSNNT